MGGARHDYYNRPVGMLEQIAYGDIKGIPVEKASWYMQPVDYAPQQYAPASSLNLGFGNINYGPNVKKPVVHTGNHLVPVGSPSKIPQRRQK